MRQPQGSVYVVATLAFLAAALTPGYGQTYSVLYNFGSNAKDAAGPASSGVIAQGRDGSLYSTTPSGGTINGGGTVFKISPAGTETVLYNFDGTHGNDPYGGLTLGTDGKLLRHYLCWRLR